MRVCKKCGVEKPLSEFHESKVNKGGHKPICRDCYNWNHRSDESKKRELEWLDLFNKGLKKCACCGEVYELGKFPIRGESRDGHKSYCYECQRIKALNDSRKPETKKKKKERESTPEFSVRLQQYRSNSEKYKISQERYKNSPKFKVWQLNYSRGEDRKIRHAISLKIYLSLRGVGIKKDAEYNEYLGCEFGFFKRHISSLWEEGMSWDNYGRGPDRWHIDHIIPVKAFNLHDPIQKKACFYYKNNQPLWEHENLKKRDHYDVNDFNGYLAWFILNVISKVA